MMRIRWFSGHDRPQNVKWCFKFTSIMVELVRYSLTVYDRSRLIINNANYFHIINSFIFVIISYYYFSITFKTNLYFFFYLCTFKFINTLTVQINVYFLSLLIFFYFFFFDHALSNFICKLYSLKHLLGCINQL